MAYSQKVLDRFHSVLDDPKKLFDEPIIKDKKWGNLYLYEYKLKDSKNLDYIIMMLKQKYESY